MLSIGKLGSGSEDYYLHAVAAGREDYYLRAGRGARALAGRRRPRPVGRGRRARAARPACRPRSSPRRPAGARPRRRADAHARLRPHLLARPSRCRCCSPLAIPSSARPRSPPTSAPWTRRSATSRATPPSFAAATTGQSACPALGLVAAGFRHRASRAGDPALHTHVLVANLAQDHEGRFGALDSRAIYRNAKSAGYLYQAELRHQLTKEPRRRVGRRSPRAPPRSPAFPPDVLDRLQPPAGRDRGAPGRARRVGPAGRRGGGAGYARRQGLLGARRGPVRRLARPSAGARLRRARARGDALARACSRARSGRASAALPRSSASPEGLTAHAATFTRQEALRELCARAGPMWGAGALGAAADLFLASDRAVLLAPDEPYAPARYSTPELLGTERELLQGALERRREGAGLVDGRTIDAGARRPSRAVARAGGDGARPRRERRRPAGRAGAGRLGQDLRPASRRARHGRPRATR